MGPSNTDPSSNNCQNPLSRETFYHLRTKLRDGAMLSAGVGILGSPLDYLKNMVMYGSKPSVRNCFRGVYLTAINDVPGASITMSTDYVAKKYFKRKNKGKPMTTFQKILSGCIGGGFAGLCIAPGQMVVLNYQRKVEKDGKVLSKLEIVREAYRQGGIRRLFIGAEMTMIRDMKYGVAYLWLADIIAKYTAGWFRSEERSVAFGGIISGAIAGGASSPSDFMRIQKQGLALSGRNVLSYPQIYRSFPTPWVMLKGIIPRMGAIAFAVFGIVEGRRHFFPDLLDDD